MNITRQVQLLATSIYFVLFFIFFNNINHGSFFERVFFATSSAFFCTISACLIFASAFLLSFYKYYDYEDFVKR